MDGAIANWRALWQKLKPLTERDALGQAISEVEDTPLLPAADWSQSPYMAQFLRMGRMTSLRLYQIHTIARGGNDRARKELQVGRARIQAEQ